MDLKLRTKSEIESTCWIEFNTSGTEDKHEYWDDNSKYLDEFSYNLFTDILEKVNEEFQYYGATLFKPVQSRLTAEGIKKRKAEIAALRSFSDLVELGTKTSNALNLSADLTEELDRCEGNFESLKEELKNLCQELTSLFETCAETNKPVWVLGL